MKPNKLLVRMRSCTHVIRISLLSASALILSSAAAQAQMKVLLVGGQPDAAQGADPGVWEFLQSRFGAANVSYKQSGESATEDADGVDVVVLSSTPGSGDIVSKFRDVTAGVLNWEEAISHVDRAGGFAFHQGGRAKTPQAEWDITNNEHYITSGLTIGPLEIWEPEAETWSLGGELAPTVTVLGTIPGDDTLPTLTVADAGVTLLGDVEAVGRRVQFPMTDVTADSFTDAGWELFGRAVEWAGGAELQRGQVFDFEEDPMLDIISSTDTTEWRETGGVNDSGYFSLTDPVGGADTTIIFPPVPDPISAFKISVDARIGGDRDRPADGFSINIVRPEDPILAEPRGDGYAGGFPQLGGLQEEGSTTGLGIGFDTWDNALLDGETERDIVGFSVRVDGVMVTQIPAATANGEPDDETSLQTGPIGSEDPPIENLTWQKFEVELTEDRMLNITWKGKKVLENFAVDWFPSENMQIVLGARTGGSWEAHHFDNLSLETVTTNLARISNFDKGRDGLNFTYANSDESTIVRDSITLTVDGAEVTPVIEDTAEGLTISYAPESPWDFASVHPWTLVAVDNNGLDIGATGEVKIASPLFPVGVPLPGPDGIDGAFSSRYIWDAGTIGNMNRALEIVLEADDPAFTGGVLDTEHEMIDHGSGGFFSNDFPYPDDFEVGEDFIQFNKGNILITEAGDYTFGVRSDDGFGVRIHGMTFDEAHGAGRLDPLLPDSFQFVGTTGNSQTRAIARNVQPGVYPLEFLWFERGGGDYGEIFAAQGVFPNEEDTEEWELIGEGIQLVGGVIDKPEIIDFSIADGVSIDFTTPDATANHVLEMSSTMEQWTPIADATLTNVDDLYNFAASRPEDPATYFRVGITPPPPLFTEDFENGAEDWTLTAPWELGAPTVGPPGANSGENVFGTDLDDLLEGNLNAALRSPVIDLTGIGRPRITFWYYVDTTEGQEGVQLNIYDETGENQLFTRGDEVFWGKTEGWTEFRLTIPEVARDQQVIFEWLLLTGDGGEAGFYLDDIEVD